MYIRGEICPILFFTEEAVIEYIFAVGSVFIISSRIKAEQKLSVEIYSTVG